MTPVKGSSRSEPKALIGNPRALPVEMRGVDAHLVELLPAIVWIIALHPISTLPEPMISVTSDGSFGSSIATLMPSFAKSPRF